MKKIAILAVAHKQNGGTFQYTCKMIESLKLNKQLDLTIYTDLSNTNYDHLGLKVIKKNYSKIKWPLIILFSFFGIKFNNHFSKQDHIIAPVYTPFLLVTKISFSYTLHDLQEHYFPSFFSFTELIWRKFINKKLIDKASFIICESDFVKNDIINFFKSNPNKIFVLPTPANKIIFNNEKKSNDSLIRFNLVIQNYIIYPSQFWKHKNHIRLLLAFKNIIKKYSTLKLVLTGRKKYEFDNIHTFAKKNNLIDNIVFTEYLNDNDLFVLLKNAKVLVMPTLFESISIPIFEAFQVGTAVCSSNVVSLPQQIGEAGILFNPIDVIEIETALSKLLENDSLRERLIKNGYNQLEIYSDINFQIKLNNFLEYL